MRTLGLLLGIISVGMFVSTVSMADPPVPCPECEKAIQACVDVVHASKVSDVDRLFFREFDAYYNPADGTVQNNAYRNGDRMPLYTFKKCMVKQGFPLK